MASSRVLRIPQSEVDGAFVLVQVTSSGSKALDLKLVATEGESPYVVKRESSSLLPITRLLMKCAVKHDRVPSLRVKNCPVSEDEWQSIIESFFNQLPLDEINATASVQSESSIAITIRKEVQGITVWHHAFNRHKVFHIWLTFPSNALAPLHYRMTRMKPLSFSSGVPSRRMPWSLAKPQRAKQRKRTESSNLLSTL